MRKQTYKTQIGLILTVTLIGLLLPGFAQAAALGAKTKGLSHEPTLRGVSSKVDNPSGRTPSEPAQQNLPAEQKDPPTRTVGTGTLSPAIIASRTSGTAPFAVFFEGTNSRDRNGNYIGDSTTTADPQSVGLLGNDILEYTWDFGEGTENDPGGRYFSGFNAAHVYETPGPYTVTLTIRDELGSESTSMPITVNAFSGETYCVSVSGDFADCPGEGAANPSYQFDSYTQAFTAIQTIQNNNIVQPGDRVLFHRGETFTYTNRVDMGNANNILIGAYGSCLNPDAKGICENNPLIQYTGSGGGSWTIAPIRGGDSDISVVDISINTDGLGDAFATDATNFLFLRGKLEHYYGFARGGNLFFIVNSRLRDASAVNMYFIGDRLVLINNEIGPAGTSHNLYGGKINRGVITGNRFQDARNGRTGLRIAANTEPGSWNVVVSNNEIDGEIFGEAFKGIGIVETSGHSIGWGAHNILIERNHVHHVGLGIQITDQGHSEIIVRNNIFRDNRQVDLNLKDASADHGFKGLRFYDNTIVNNVDTIAVKIQTSNHEDVKIFNNIIYGTTDRWWVRAIVVDYASGMDELTSNNNLFYYPNRPDDQIFWVEGTAYNLEGWRSTFGEDLGSFVDNPLLMNVPFYCEKLPFFIKNIISAVSGESGGRTTLTKEGVDFENLQVLPGYRVRITGSSEGPESLDCDGDGVPGTDYDDCRGEAVFSVDTNTLTLTEDIIYSGSPTIDFDVWYSPSTESRIYIADNSWYTLDDVIDYNTEEVPYTIIASSADSLGDYIDITPLLPQRALSGKLLCNWGYQHYDVVRDYHLQSTSPAIDTGMSLPLVFEDYDNNPRPQDGPDPDTIPQWDIGAYEYALLTLPGDFDADGDVDMDDYAMFEEAYTGANRPVAPGYEYADLDGDGDVDLDDFSIFAANYTG